MSHIKISINHDGLLTGFPYHDAFVKELRLFDGIAKITLVKNDITYAITLEGLIACACSEFLPGALCGWIWILPPDSERVLQNQAFSSQLKKQNEWPENTLTLCLDGSFGISFAACCHTITAEICTETKQVSL
jgi:hypothetical protein